MPEKSNPTLSIIIVSYNTADITVNCLKSILQDKGLKTTPYEIIVIDNASSDDSVLEIKKFKKTFDIRNLTLEINQSNLGFAKACNQGAKLAVGKYLLFLNSDIQLVDNSLISMLSYLKKHHYIGAIGPQFLNPDLSLQPSVFPNQTVLNAFKEFWLGHPAYSKYQPAGHLPQPVWAISGGALMISSALFVHLGGWNEKYFFYFEDLDLCRSLHRRHKQVYFYPSAKIIHYHGLSGKNLTNTSDQWRRLIPGSIKYHGLMIHYLINFIIWSGQKWQKLKSVKLF